ncbi:MAG TPA: hypothetical protein VF941_06625 [Clostridia bacterium]
MEKENIFLRLADDVEEINKLLENSDISPETKALICRLQMNTTEALQEALKEMQHSNKVTENTINVLEEERTARKNFYDNFCISFLADPKGVFTKVLQQVERNAKIESGDGQENLRWGLQFPLIARLELAFRLITGSKLNISP